MEGLQKFLETFCAPGPLPYEGMGNRGREALKPTEVRRRGRSVLRPFRIEDIEVDPEGGGGDEIPPTTTSRSR